MGCSTVAVAIASLALYLIAFQGYGVYSAPVSDISGGIMNPGSNQRLRGRALVYSRSPSSHQYIRPRTLDASTDTLNRFLDEDEELDISKRQSDDYGHMRFGRAEQFDDYGHLRFGRSLD